MCGISGIISSNSFDLEIIKAMNDTMLHRGPDGSGLMLSKNNEIKYNHPDLIDFSPSFEEFVALGHRRLSIVDLSNLGHQPMVYQERYVITFNGEIYNHEELRIELENLGYNFLSKSDTEVIIAAYDAWGSNCLKKFNGMWAFCIIDSLKQVAFISRDRFGVKPLYYFKKDGLFVFASEIKALIKHPDVNVAANKSFALKYIKSGFDVNGVETIYDEIYRFPAASYLECEINDLTQTSLNIKIFWSVHPNLSNEIFDEDKATKLTDEYSRLLEDSVKLRLRADVKVGSALSGGLDSSSIVYLINKILREQKKVELQETFSCVYASAGTTHCDESIFINKLAKELNVNNNQIEPNENEIPFEHGNMIYAMDQPPENTCMSGWHTFKLVKKSNVKVTLDGQGADEQLAGYLIYWIYLYAQMPLWRALTSWPKLIRMPGSIRIVIPGVMINLCGNLIGRKFTKMILRGLGFKFDPFTPLNQVLNHDREHSLMTLLHYSDSISMAWSIESRMPFMDYRLVDFLASVPAAYKMHDGWTKYLARRAFSGKLPDEIVWRKDKMGWPIPEDHWFNGGLKEWMNSKLVNKNLFNWLGKDLTVREFGESMKMNQKIRLLNLATWFNNYVNHITMHSK